MSGRNSNKDNQIIRNSITRTAPINPTMQNTTMGIRRNMMNMTSEKFLQESADTGRAVGGPNVPDYLDMQRRANARRLAQFGSQQGDL